MKKVAAALISAALFCAGVFSLAQAQSPQVRQLLLQRQIPVAATTTAFSGPGDVVASATGHWGAEAYNAAYATGLNKAFNVCLAADATCADLSFDATGTVVNSLVGVSLCSAVTCTIKTAYDQTGNGNDITNATEATRPTIQFNCQGGRACMVFASGAKLSKSNWNGSTNVAQPWTISCVFNDTATSAVTGGTPLSSNDGAGTAGGAIFTNGTGDEIDLFAGSAVTVTGSTAAHNVWHSVSGVGNNASSDLNIDGTANTGTSGTRTLRSGLVVLGNDFAGDSFVGKLGRCGAWPSGFSSGNSTSMSTQDHAFWGF